jgi:hypothetical protein
MKKAWAQQDLQGLTSNKVLEPLIFDHTNFTLIQKQHTKRKLEQDLRKAACSSQGARSMTTTLSIARGCSSSRPIERSDEDDAEGNSRSKDP